MNEERLRVPYTFPIPYLYLFFLVLEVLFVR